MVKFTFLSVVVGLLGGFAQAQSQSISLQKLSLSYHCQSSHKIVFASGDRRHELVDRQVEWVLREPENINLIIGQQEFLLRPHLGNAPGELQMSLMRRQFGEGYRVVETKDFQIRALTFSMSYKDSYDEDVLVKCLIKVL